MRNFRLLIVVLSIVLSGRGLLAQYASSNFSLVGLADPETTYNADSLKYSGCWGWYQETKNKEYAIACSHRGTYWIDITVPSSPTVSAYRAGKKSGCTWREAKSYKNYLYVISDDFGSNSFQIFDMQYLPDSVHKVYDGTSLFSQGHTLWVDGDFLYVASVTAANNFSSMCVYSLANPASPFKLRALEEDYPFINHVHDMFVRHDTIYASCGYQGLYVFTYASNTFSMVGSLTSYTASGYNHSSALTPDGKTLVFTDEVPAGLPTKLCDVTNPGNIQVLSTVQQFPQTTPHNPFVPNNEQCFLSSYQDGLQLYDISNPSSPQLAGYFDTYPQSGGNVNNYPSSKTYAGQWGCYPFFPSGNVFALDRRNGAFILSTPLYGGPLIGLDVSLPATACMGSTVLSTARHTGASSVSWAGQGLAFNSITSQSAAISFSAPGVYSLAVAASNAGSVTTVVRTITVYAISAAATVTNPSCASCTNGVIQMTPSSGTAPYVYAWTPAGGTASVATGLAQGCYTVTISDAMACTATVQTCLQGSTVGSENVSKKDFRIYPNPVNERLFLEVDQSSRYVIRNLLGEIVLQGPALPGTQVIDVSGLSKGMYSLYLLSARDKKVMSLVVE